MLEGSNHPEDLTTLPRELLPKNLLMLEDQAGNRAMIALLDKFSGCVLSIPHVQELTHEHPLWETLGPEAVTFCQAFAREIISIPKAHKAMLHVRNYRIRQGRDSGKSYNRLAGEFNLTTRQIITICETCTPEDFPSQ